MPFTKSDYAFPMLFFLAFSAVGTVMTVVLVVAPALWQASAREWLPVECTIVHTRSATKNYLNEFTYAYNGVTYRSDQYSFFGKWSHVRYREGDRVTGAVNPRRPEEAVLRPEESPTALACAGLVAFAILPFVIALRIWRIRSRSPAKLDS